MRRPSSHSGVTDYAPGRSALCDAEMGIPLQVHAGGDYGAAHESNAYSNEEVALVGVLTAARSRRRGAG
eukprot:CAMPEP_0205900922 /NCGR_PEP_ID=MMETSP1083-20121108/27398_1 /ASSEMBLY_ACC=CAM_ASM_000430 /TAXON_ID=97485 /ORGANISM="Prymnesium parvum, Strain Texoma1" /LENGTH=68 /DNA_ID=CAMNT_0053266399 /DNA_START=1047 /DNA_END=1249 /DNA_ORIENTATION=+